MNTQYEYFDNDKEKWVGLVEMHYHAIEGDTATLYGREFKVRPVDNPIQDLIKALEELNRYVKENIEGVPMRLIDNADAAVKNAKDAIGNHRC